MGDLLLGFVMGIANLLPGISGGTIVFVSGKYRLFVSAVADLLRFKIAREEVLFLLKIGIGAAVSIALLSKIVDHLYSSFPIQTTSFFAGLIAGGLFLLWKGIRFGFLPSVMMALGALSMVGLESITGGDLEPGAFQLILGGFIAGGTMILPGVSGSSMLVLLGLYDDAISAVANLDFLKLLWIGIGAILGILAVSILMKELVERFENETVSFLYGLTLAGLIYIVSSSASVPFLLLGFAAMIILSRVI